MKIIADLHLHSRFSRAVSAQMNIPTIAEWAKKKGIGLMGTGDFTHPVWLRELKANLKEKASGIYEASSQFFLLTTELSCIYSQGGKTRRIHLLLLAPDFEAVERINKDLTRRGMNLLSDGRPILSLSAKALTEIVLEIDQRCLLIPAHAWTPWFSLYGSMSGFDSLEECFGEMTKNIYAVETGLSSDPAMNWKIEELQKRSIVSFSDAHSPQKLGREATVFELPETTYENIREGIVSNSAIKYTLEFYPEEGKYHFTGHRNCQIVYSPHETRKKGVVCPVCGKTLTVGVASRVEQLGRVEAEIETKEDEFGVKWIKDKRGNRPPYIMMVPLLEILAEAMSSTVSSQKVMSLYQVLINAFGGEFSVLLAVGISEIRRIAGERIAEAISKVRSGDIYIEPGYDGLFGKVKIWSEAENVSQGEKLHIDQRSLF